MKKEIKTRADVEQLVNSFYEKVFADDLLGPVFLDVAKIDPDHHFPILYNFWEAVLFGAPAYKGNPMEVHLELDRKTQLSPHHFQRWLQLFKKTVDELFEGSKAEETKLRASSIAQLMELKVQQNRD